MSSNPIMQLLRDVLNYFQINLKFTLETETIHTFHFLDVNIKHYTNRFSTLAYFKNINYWLIHIKAVG